MAQRPITLIAGPTASGKSSLAMEIARKQDALIVNADSMQVYDVLRLLTARPSEEDEAQVPHRLFGHVHPSVDYSAGQWLRDVSTLMEEEKERPLVFVGGTGLYFKALEEGLSEMPVIPPEIRNKWRKRLQEEGAEQLHHVLWCKDKSVADRLKRNDGQRIVRALEVFEASGRSIDEWQGRRSKSIIENTDVDRFNISPNRNWLEMRIRQRLEQMLAQGVLDEVRALLDLRISDEKPAMRAIGVKEFAPVLNGTETAEKALEKAVISTRQYAKRQRTWFKNQLDASWKTLDPSI